MDTRQSVVGESDTCLSGSPLRLLFVIDSLDIGGAEMQAIRLASALVRKGHQVTLACSKGGALALSAEQAGISLRPLLGYLVKRRFSFTYARRLSQLLHQGHFDLVHAHLYASAAASAYATIGTNVPLIISEQSQAQWRTWYAHCCSRWFYSRSKHIIAVSQDIQNRLIKQDKVSAKRISLIMNTLPPEAELYSNKQPELLIDLPAVSLVGIVARLQPEKGVSYFLEAASHIVRSLPHVHFVVIGDGPLRQELQTYAMSLNLQDHIHFLGSLLDARSLISRFDVLVISSLYGEGTPLVSLEAMMAGVPVVATKVGGIPEQNSKFT